jgi:hypothetical protein
MDSTTYEKFRDRAIERLVSDLRELFDECFELAQKNGHKPTRRLKGLKQVAFIAMNNLAEHGFEDFDINDVIQEMQNLNHQMARAILTDLAKKASLSSMLRRLADSKDTIEVGRVGKGRRATQYKFTNEVLDRIAMTEDAGSIAEPSTRLSEWSDKRD